MGRIGNIGIVTIIKIVEPGGDHIARPVNRRLISKDRLIPKTGVLPGKIRGGNGKYLKGLGDRILAAQVRGDLQLRCIGAWISKNQ